MRFICFLVMAISCSNLYAQSAPSLWKIGSSDGIEPLISSRSVEIGKSAAAQVLRHYEDPANGSNYVAIQAASTMADNYTLTLPDAVAGGNGYALTSTTGGVLSWTEITSGISDLVSDLTPQLGGDLDLNSSDITGTGNISLTGTIDASSTGTFGGSSSLGMGTFYGAASGKGLVVRANAATPGNIIEAQNSAGTALTYINNMGDLIVGDGTDYIKMDHNSGFPVVATTEGTMTFQTATNKSRITLAAASINVNGKSDNALTMYITENVTIGGGVSPAGRLHVDGAASGKTIVAKANATAPGNNFEGQNSAGTANFTVSAAGAITKLNNVTVPIATYTPTNDSTDRAFDANSTTTEELADVLATLITDLP